VPRLGCAPNPAIGNDSSPATGLTPDPAIGLSHFLQCFELNKKKQENKKEKGDFLEID
jgi:hypothetical protein